MPNLTTPCPLQAIHRRPIFFILLATSSPMYSFVPALPVSSAQRRKSCSTTNIHRSNNKVSPNLKSYKSTIKSVTTNSNTNNQKSLPNSVRDSNVVILGGGPCGSTIAALLQHNGIAVTIIEKVSDFDHYDISKSYSMKLSWRTRKTLRSVPNLYESVFEKSIPATGNKLLCYKPDKQLLTLRINIGKTPSDGLPDLRILRPLLVQQLRNFLDRCQNVNKMYGTQVKDVKFKNDGQIELIVDTDGKTESINTKLVIACDGRNSIIGRKLDMEVKERSNSFIYNVKGSGRAIYNSPAVGLNIRVIMLKKDAIKRIDAMFSDNDPNSGNDIVRIFGGQKEGRAKNRIFNLGIFVQTDENIDMTNGVMANVVRPSNHDVWKLKTIEEGYELFQENFPQIDVKEWISTDAMEQFINADALPFPSITRRKSLVSMIKDENGNKVSGVIFCGDSAHSFPPDTGEGVNSGMEDILVVSDIIGTSNENISIQDILMEYERRRDAQISGLISMCRFAAPYQYQQNDLGVLYTELNAKFRKTLAEWFPGVLYPCMRQYMWTDLSYEEITRRADLTTQRLWLAAALLVAVPVMAMMAMKIPS